MDRPAKITPIKMVMLGIGWFGVSFFWAFHSATIPLFLNNFTNSKFMISLILGLPGLAGCIIPPISGYLSDNSHSRFGRRGTYVSFGILFAFISILALSFGRSFGIVALISGIMYFSLRFAETPYLALLPDITPPEQRSTASGTMNLFGSIGMIIYFLIGSQVWDLNPGVVFITVALTLLIFVFSAIFLIKEPENSQAKKAKSPGISIAKASKYLKGLIEEKNVLKFFIAQFFWWMGFWMITSFLTLFVVEELKVEEGKSFFVLLIFAIVATIFMLPMGILGDRFGRKGIISVMIGFWAIAGTSISLSQNFIHAIITVGITGIPYSAVIGIGFAFLLDLIPQDRIAEFVGLSTISVALSQIFGPLVGGKIIDLIGYRMLFPVAALSMLSGLGILQFVRPQRIKKPG